MPADALPVTRAPRPARSPARRSRRASPARSASRTSLLLAVLLAAAIGSPAVQAQVPACGPRVPARSLSDPFGPYGGCAPGSAPWEYDTGGDNDRSPERPRYQQGGGQQTGGPARNLIPSDRLHLVPR